MVQISCLAQLSMILWEKWWEKKIFTLHQLFFSFYVSLSHWECFPVTHIKKQTYTLNQWGKGRYLRPAGPARVADLLSALPGLSGWETLQFNDTLCVMYCVSQTIKHYRCSFLLHDTPYFAEFYTILASQWPVFRHWFSSWWPKYTNSLYKYILWELLLVCKNQRAPELILETTGWKVWPLSLVRY